MDALLCCPLMAGSHPRNVVNTTWWPCHIPEIYPAHSNLLGVCGGAIVPDKNDKLADCTLSRGRRDKAYWDCQLNRTPIPTILLVLLFMHSKCPSPCNKGGLGHWFLRHFPRNFLLGQKWYTTPLPCMPLPVVTTTFTNLVAGPASSMLLGLLISLCTWNNSHWTSCRFCGSSSFCSL